MKSHLKFVIRHAHTTHRKAVLQAFDPTLEEGIVTWVKARASKFTFSVSNLHTNTMTMFIEVKGSHNN